MAYLRPFSHLIREGVSVGGIRNALKEIGMESATFEMTPEQLRDNCPLPAILHWEQNHFVVLYDVKYHRLKKRWYFYIANPAYGKIKFNEEKFSHFWLNGPKGIVVAVEPTTAFYAKASTYATTLPYFQDKKILRICQIQKLCLSLHPNSEQHDLDSHIGVAKFTFASLTLGEMVEWSITAVLKTAVPRGTGGSNPSLSAKWLQDDFIMVVKTAFKISVNRCKTYTYNDFSLYISLHSDG